MHVQHGVVEIWRVYQGLRLKLGFKLFPVRVSNCQTLTRITIPKDLYLTCVDLLLAFLLGSWSYIDQCLTDSQLWVGLFRISRWIMSVTRGSLHCTDTTIVLPPVSQKRAHSPNKSRPRTDITISPVDATSPEDMTSKKTVNLPSTGDLQTPPGVHNDNSPEQANVCANFEPPPPTTMLPVLVW